MKIDRIYMERAIALARNGLGSVSPNPMVGAVIVDSAGRIVGEGWHRRFGQGHAEVNAVASVADKSLLHESTMYVTLEPCSHYGKTPPCARLLIDCGVPRVVVGSLDPFVEVAGRGVAMLRDAGVDVAVGVMEEECRQINPFFMTAHTHRRPWVTLKWAQSVDGFIDRCRNISDCPTLFSSQTTVMLGHRLRSLHDAIVVGSGTMIADRPSLTVRQWPGRSPRRFVADRAGRLSIPDGFSRLSSATVNDMLTELYLAGVTSVLVEGGTQLINSFISAGVYDLIRVETATDITLGDGVVAPNLSGLSPIESAVVGQRQIDYYGTLPWFLKCAL